MFENRVQGIYFPADIGEDERGLTPFVYIHDGDPLAVSWLSFPSSADSMKGNAKKSRQILRMQSPVKTSLKLLSA